MSDYTVDEQLEGCRRTLLFNSIFFCVGWFLFFFRLFNGDLLRNSGFLGNNLGWIGWAILGGPRIWKVIIGGFGAALKPDYEVVTTHGDGRTTSDGGSQSIMMGFAGRIIFAAVMLLIGGLITIVHQFILTIKYIALHIKASPKPAFAKSGMLIILISSAVFIGSIVISFAVNMIESAAFNAAYASEHGVKTTGDFVTELNKEKDGRIISGYKGKGGDVVIPATIDGLPVLAIDGYAFLKIDITSLVIPEGVTDIKDVAFPDCEKLVSVTLPRSLQRIGSKAFRDCTSLTDVSIPPGSTIKYGSYASNLPLNQTGTFINAVDSYFIEGQEVSGNYNDQTFNGCTKLSAASKQAIQASGYTGGF